MWLRRFVLATIAALISCASAQAQTTPYGAYVFPDSGTTFTATGSNAINVSSTETVTLTATASGTYSNISVQGGGVLDATQLTAPVLVTGTLFGSGTFEGDFEVQGQDIPSGLQTIAGTAAYDGSSQLLCGLLEASSTDTQLAVAQVAAQAVTTASGAQLGIYVYSASNFSRAFWFQPQQWPLVTASLVTGTFASNVVLSDGTNQGGGVSPGTGQFSVAQSGTAVSLAWTPTPFSLYLWDTFGAEAGVSGTGGALDAPDGDGISNLLKYALGLPQGQNDSADLPTVSISGTQFSITYSRLDSASDITYTPQWSTDLTTWTAISGSIPTLSDNGTVQTQEATVSGTAFALYMRLQVTDTDLAKNTSTTGPVGINYLGEKASVSGSIGAFDAPDGDGIPNLIKFATGLTPGQNDTAGLPKISVSGTQYTLSYTLADSATSTATTVVQWSKDLLTWSGSNVTSQTIANTGTTESIQSSVNVPSFAAYMRLQVTDLANDVAYTPAIGINFIGEQSGSSGIIGAANAADNDGVANLIKFALGLTPGKDDVAGLPTAALSGTQLTLTYVPAVSATGATTIYAQSSSDLKNWTKLTGSGQPLITGGTNQVFIPTSGTSQGFIQLVVTDNLGDSGSTEPVGFVNVTVAASSGSGTAVHQWLTTPFRQAAVHQGIIESVDSLETITIAKATWNDDLASTPHIACFLTGSAMGLSLPITSNTSGQLTLDTSGILTAFTKAGNFAPPWSAADSVEILPADTLGSLVGGQGLDSAQVIVTSGTAPSATSGSSGVVYPADPVFVAYSGTMPLTVSFVGTVPPTQTVTIVSAPGFTAVGNPRFFGTWNASTLAQTSGWVAGNDPQTVDSLRFWTGEQWAVYYYTSSGLWRQAGNLLNASFSVPVPEIPAEGGVVINRGEKVAPLLLVSPAPYQP